MNPCTYSIVTDYFTPTALVEGKSTQMHLEGDASNMFMYYIPQDSNDGAAKAMTFTVVSEDNYDPITIYFSLNSQIYQFDQQSVDNLMSNGVGFYFTNEDYGWCTMCFVYFYVEIQNPGRYYFTATSTSRNPIILINAPAQKFVNNQQQDCFQYFVTSAPSDVLFTLNHYEGQVDFYVAGQNSPSGVADP